MSRSVLLFPACFMLVSVPLAPLITLGGCVVHETDAAAFDRSRSVAEVEVVSAEPFLFTDQTIRTRLVLRLIERFKGDAPGRIEIISAGGTIGNRTDFRSDSLQLEAGKSYVLMMDRDAVGNWSAQPHHAYQAPAARRDVTDFFRAGAHGPRPTLVPASAPETVMDQSNAGVPGSVVTSTGYTDTGSPLYQPARLTTCDGDEPIPYLIDIDATKLPTGMDEAGAVAAVAEAFNAWAASSSLKFRYEGTQSFGTAVSNITIQDRRLRIQLHDNYNVVSGALGIGGGSSQSPSATFTGGKVGSQGFQERLYGFVVLESTTNASFMQTTANFKRVLTHEIGHALGLAHSSEIASEPNAILKAATMYYTSAAGSTGATIQTYDVDRIQFGYPVGNTPPYTCDRIIPAVTTDPYYGALPIDILGVNRIQLRATDRQSTPLTASITSTSGNGTFSLSGTTLIYSPPVNAAAPRIVDSSIEAGNSYGTANVQFSDGVNLSRAVSCIVIGFFFDTTPADGLPDDWMIANFTTSAVGAIGSPRHPDSDPDKDGLTNRAEFYLNTNPNSAASGPVKPTYNHNTRMISYTPVRFAPYGVESSSTLNSGSWTLRRVGTRYQAGGTLSSDFSGNATPANEFYRVVTGP